MTDRPPALGLRPTAEVIARLDVLARDTTEETGIPATRSAVAMAALIAGLALLEQRREARRAKPSKGARA